ncbi:hypothetical protein FRC07_001583 [Ceratobasidium sp. 392]|nr:hypothetical protein FRC07_001583 [Ceratobasidium sp. 392]
MSPQTLHIRNSHTASTAPAGTPCYVDETPAPLKSKGDEEGLGVEEIIDSKQEEGMGWSGSEIKEWCKRQKIPAGVYKAMEQNLMIAEQAWAVKVQGAMSEQLQCMMAQLMTA